MYAKPIHYIQIKILYLFTYCVFIWFTLTSAKTFIHLTTNNTLPDIHTTSWLGIIRCACKKVFWIYFFTWNSFRFAFGFGNAIYTIFNYLYIYICWMGWFLLTCCKGCKFTIPLRELSPFQRSRFCRTLIKNKNNDFLKILALYPKVSDFLLPAVQILGATTDAQIAQNRRTLFVVRLDQIVGRRKSKKTTKNIRQTFRRTIHWTSKTNCILEKPTCT